MRKTITDARRNTAAKKAKTKPAAPAKVKATVKVTKRATAKRGAASSVNTLALHLSTEIASASLDQLCTRLSRVTDAPVDTYKPLTTTANTDMDPRLQLAVINRRSGKRSRSIAAASENELPVVARVTDVDAWKAIADVLPGAELGMTVDGSQLVTGRIHIDRIEAVRAEPAVLSLKASQPVRPVLQATVRTMGVRADLLPASVAPKGGKGVVVGIVDTGGDFAHRNFRKSNGKTRLLALWYQGGVAKVDSPFGYGRLFSPKEINAALTVSDPYAALGYGPRVDAHGAHGTHVMDIAAGNGLGTTSPGVAPEADLIFVEVAASDIQWQGPDSVKQAFGDSVQMLEAIRFVFDTAGNRPCVVNLSLGTNGGPHDGTSLVEQGIDAIVREKPNRAVVIAASNSQLDGIHASGHVPAAGDLDLTWRVFDAAGGEFELWYDGASRLQVTLIGPDGTIVATVQPGANLPLGSGGQIAVFVSSRLNDPNNHCNVIGIWLAEGVPGGEWKVRLHSLGGKAVEFHAWLERFDGAQSSFAQSVPTHTLGSISTGHESVVVGSYDAHKTGFPLSNFSSSGPTRDGRKKPEVSAPGGFVVAARSRTGTGVTTMSGTSMAAPAVTGLIALILAEAKRKGKSLTIQEIRERLLGQVEKKPPASGQGVWDARYGMGRVSGKAI